MFSQYSKIFTDFRMASCNAVLKSESESKSELRQVSNSAQTQHFSSLKLLLDSYMPEMALSSKFIFTVIDIPMFRLYIVSVDRTIAIGSDFDPYGLLVISDSSDAISTSPRLFLLIFYLPLPFYTE